MKRLERSRLSKAVIITVKEGKEEEDDPGYTGGLFEAGTGNGAQTYNEEEGGGGEEAFP